jgi:hypothetical protein
MAFADQINGLGYPCIYRSDRPCGVCGAFDLALCYNRGNGTGAITYTGKPATEITYRSFLDFLQDADLRRALRRYLRWLAHMSKLPRF